MNLAEYYPDLIVGKENPALTWASIDPRGRFTLQRKKGAFTPLYRGIQDPFFSSTYRFSPYVYDIAENPDRFTSAISRLSELGSYNSEYKIILPTYRGALNQAPSKLFETYKYNPLIHRYIQGNLPITGLDFLYHAVDDNIMNE